VSLEVRRFTAATDPEVVRPLLVEAMRAQHCAEGCAVHIDVPRAIQRSDGGVTIQYRITWMDATQPSPQSLLLCGRLLGDAEPWPRGSAGDGYLRMQDLRLLVPVFPFDPALPSLPEFCAPASAVQRMRDAGVQHALTSEAHDHLDVRVLAYRLERRCVLRYRSIARPAAPGIIAKVMQPRRIGAVRAALAHIEAVGEAARDTALAIPRTLAVDEYRGVLYCAEVPGMSLHDLDVPADLTAGCAMAGRALRSLHAIPCAAAESAPVGEEMKLLRARVAFASDLFPRHAAAFEAALHELVAAGEILPRAARITWIHRDFYDKQVLVTAAGATVLDWDGLACGDPAQDFGNFLAHVDLRALQNPGAAIAWRSGGGAFTDAYGATDAASLLRTSWWRASALLRLATLYALRKRWQMLVAPLLEACLMACPREGRLVQE